MLEFKAINENAVRPAREALQSVRGGTPLVSIIIPTLNSGRSLPSTLQSIRRQTYRNIEVIVVDNFSTDNTQEVARSFEGTRFCTAGGERSRQINYGESVSKGEYIYRIDSDFTLQPGVVEEAVSVCERGADAALIHNTSDPSVSFWAKVRKAERDSLVDDTEHVAARFVRRDAYEKLGGFDESLYAEEDRDFHERLVEAGYRVSRISSVEIHVGEPKTLAEIVRKHVYYGKSIRLYAEKKGMRATIRLGPFRRAFLRHWRSLARDPTILVGFFLYQYVRHASSVVGLWSGEALHEPEMRVDYSIQPDPVPNQVSVVIVTRNRSDEVEECLTSLEESKLQIKEVIVVDDASATPFSLSNPRLPITVLRNQRRSFLAHSRNVGARAASGGYVMFVDDDNVLDRGCLAELRRRLDEDQTTLIASPVICYKSDPRRVWFAGGWFAPISCIFVAAFRGRNVNQLPKTPYFTGTFHDAFMARKDLFEKVGYFDETNFPMYLGEADMAARMRERGFTVGVAPSAVVWHDIALLEGGSSLLRGVHITEPVRAYFVGRNRLIYMRRHSSLPVFLIHVAVFEPLIFSIHLFAMLSGHGDVPWTRLFGPYLRGVLDGLSRRTRLGRELLQNTGVAANG